MSKNSGKNNHFIDVLKGICIIFIITTHFSFTTEERLHFLFSYWIEMAVPMFMIISGYVYCLSYQRQNITCFNDAYHPRNVVNKILRYTIPFLITYVLELVYFSLIGQITISGETLLEWIFCFAKGGIGPGSYYYPIMIQFIFVYPAIYFIIKRNGAKGLITCFAINALYELLQRGYGMDGELYRLLLFRYIFVIGAGCYMASEKSKLSFKIGLPLCLLGGAFLLATDYLGYSPKIIIYWKNTSFIACLYIVPIMFLLIKKVKNFRFVPLEIIGKASYNIFLVQMVWYTVGSWYLEKFIQSRVFLLGANILVCIVGGVIFYYIETPITKWIIKKTYTNKYLKQQ